MFIRGDGFPLQTYEFKIYSDIRTPDSYYNYFILRLGAYDVL